MENQEEKITVLFKKLDDGKIISVSDKKEADLIIEIDLLKTNLLKNIETNSNHTFLDIEPLEIIIFRVKQNYGILYNNTINSIGRLKGNFSDFPKEENEFEINGQFIEIAEFGKIEVRSFQIEHIKDCLIELITK